VAVKYVYDINYVKTC